MGVQPAGSRGDSLRASQPNPCMTRTFLSSFSGVKCYLVLVRNRNSSVGGCPRMDIGTDGLTKTTVRTEFPTQRKDGITRAGQEDLSSVGPVLTFPASCLGCLIQGLCEPAGGCGEASLPSGGSSCLKNDFLPTNHRKRPRWRPGVTIPTCSCNC